MVLWDPSHPSIHPFDTWDEDLQMWRVDHGYDVLMTDAYKQSWADAPVERQARQVEIPTKVIGAGASLLSNVGGRYAELFAGRSEHVVIEGAQHSFGNDDAAEALFAETVDWLQQHGR